MRFQDLLNERTIQMKMRAASKQEVLEHLYGMLHTGGCLTDVSRFAAAVQAREKCGPTGIGGMVAITHGCSDAVTRSCIAVARLEKPVEWETLDSQPVRVVLLFAIRSNQDEIQLRAMALIAQFLGQEEYRHQLLKCRTKRGLLRLLNEIPAGELDARLRLVAVTACPAGVAHTYISQECLIQAALARHHSIKVETQGAVGVENHLTTTEIQAADAVIIAADIKIEGMERFEGKRIVRVPISTAICSADILLEKIEERLGCCVEKKI